MSQKFHTAALQARDALRRAQSRIKKSEVAYALANLEAEKALDELALLASTSTEKETWLRGQGWLSSIDNQRSMNLKERSGESVEEIKKRSAELLEEIEKGGACMVEFSRGASISADMNKEALATALHDLQAGSCQFRLKKSAN